LYAKSTAPVTQITASVILSPASVTLSGVEMLTGAATCRFHPDFFEAKKSIEGDSGVNSVEG